MTTYAVGRPEDGRIIMAGQTGTTPEEAQAILIFKRIEFPSIYKDAKIYALTECPSPEAPVYNPEFATKSSIEAYPHAINTAEAPVPEVCDAE